MGAIVSGETSGRVRNMGPAAPATRIFFRPTMRKLIYRKANVYRRSEAVKARNKKLQDAAIKPATACKGKPWDDFVKCLKTEMKKI